MATSSYTHLRGAVRIYDGAGTPKYITIPFVQVGSSFPFNRPRPAPVLHLDRNVFNSYTNFTRGTEEGLATPVSVTFTAELDEQTAAAVIHACSNPYQVTPWLVNGSTFVTAAGTGANIINGLGASFAPPQFGDDPTHIRVHLEWLFDGKTAGVNARLCRHEECYFPPDLNTYIDGDTTGVSLTYWCYGKISTGTAFTSGTNVTPTIT
jgi:hypothetical protein